MFSHRDRSIKAFSYPQITQISADSRRNWALDVGRLALDVSACECRVALRRFKLLRPKRIAIVIAEGLNCAERGSSRLSASHSRSGEAARNSCVNVS